VSAAAGCLETAAQRSPAGIERVIAGRDRRPGECTVKRTGCNGFCEFGRWSPLSRSDIYYHVMVEMSEILEKKRSPAAGRNAPALQKRQGNGSEPEDNPSMPRR
jgi:hypothetical protein